MAVKIKAENGIIIGFAAITGSYTNIGSATTRPLRYVSVKNGTNATVIVSWDGGETDSLPMVANSAESIEATQLKSGNEDPPMLEALSQFQIKHNGSAPTSGDVTITRVYAE
jgi:hypothetical protein